MNVGQHHETHFLQTNFSSFYLYAAKSHRKASQRFFLQSGKLGRPEQQGVAVARKKTPEKSERTDIIPCRYLQSVAITSHYGYEGGKAFSLLEKRPLRPCCSAGGHLHPHQVLGVHHGSSLMKQMEQSGKSTHWTIKIWQNVKEPQDKNTHTQYMYV